MLRPPRLLTACGSASVTGFFPGLVAGTALALVGPLAGCAGGTRRASADLSVNTVGSAAEVDAALRRQPVR